MLTTAAAAFTAVALVAGCGGSDVQEAAGTGADSAVTDTSTDTSTGTDTTDTGAGTDTAAVPGAVDAGMGTGTAAVPGATDAAAVSNKANTGWETVISKPTGTDVTAPSDPQNSA